MTTEAKWQAIVQLKDQQIAALQKQILYLIDQLAKASIVEKEFLLS